MPPSGSEHRFVNLDNRRERRSVFPPAICLLPANLGDSGNFGYLVVELPELRAINTLWRVLWRTLNGFAT
jgi:hypothetical protein